MSACLPASNGKYMYQGTTNSREREKESESGYTLVALCSLRYFIDRVNENSRRHRIPFIMRVFALLLCTSGAAGGGVLLRRRARQPDKCGEIKF